MDEYPAGEQLEQFQTHAWLLPEIREPGRGDHCPNCGEGVLDYDGMLNLSCAACGFSLVGCFT